MDQTSVSGQGTPSDRASLQEGVSVSVVGWKDVLSLTKPGINLSNAWACLTGLWLASNGAWDWGNLSLTLAGILLVVGGSCALNNSMDGDIDRFMERTKNRPVPAGRIHRETAFALGALLTAVGEALLFLGVNPLTAFLAACGAFLYVVIYSLWLKRVSVSNTIVGSLSGAVPPLVGWTAVRDTLDWPAWVLFGILFLWQPPHFFALAILKKEDYRKADIPMLPVVKGSRATWIQMTAFVALLIPVSLLPVLSGTVGGGYLLIASVLGGIYFCLSVRGMFATEEKKWARRMFRFSLAYLTVILTALAVFADTALP
ncbi:protoheme IX farnesyltransferase [Melghirimyces profundicolus]|uniref:Protoheme IX farnesyltransferase n=1 Tax=Melghirimyces profundicolus TaxID=1242148 RepID=A0A2T6BXD0_9BACL|nr:heme o synthase [Melghirimyces profundicolus]PTX60725.1 protoheme IX farnesyltransferase [Melghirimyces profundicolus]